MSLVVIIQPTQLTSLWFPSCQRHLLLQPISTPFSIMTDAHQQPASAADLASHVPVSSPAHLSVPCRYVIDTGLVKARGYNAKLGVDSLQVVPVSQAQARQRSGRAGMQGRKAWLALQHRDGATQRQALLALCQRTCRKS